MRYAVQVSLSNKETGEAQTRTFVSQVGKDFATDSQDWET